MSVIIVDGKDVYKCEVCGAEFKSADLLMAHKTIHAAPAVKTTTVQTTTVKEG